MAEFALKEVCRAACSAAADGGEIDIHSVDALNKARVLGKRKKSDQHESSRGSAGLRSVSR